MGMSSLSTIGLESQNGSTYNTATMGSMGGPGSIAYSNAASTQNSVTFLQTHEAGSASVSKPPPMPSTSPVSSMGSGATSGPAIPARPARPARPNPAASVPARPSRPSRSGSSFDGAAVATPVPSPVPAPAPAPVLPS